MTSPAALRAELTRCAALRQARHMLALDTSELDAKIARLRAEIARRRSDPQGDPMTRSEWLITALIVACLALTVGLLWLGQGAGR